MKKIIFLIIPTYLFSCPPPCADAPMLRATTTYLKNYYDVKDNELALKLKEFKEVIDLSYELQVETNLLLEDSLQFNTLNIITRQIINTEVKSQLKMLGEK